MSTKTHYRQTFKKAVSIVTRCHKYRCSEQWEAASKWLDLAVRYYPRDIALQWEYDAFFDKFLRWRRGSV